MELDFILFHKCSICFLHDYQLNGILILRPMLVISKKRWQGFKCWKENLEHKDILAAMFTRVSWRRKIEYWSQDKPSSIGKFKRGWSIFQVIEYLTSKNLEWSKVSKIRNKYGKLIMTWVIKSNYFWQPQISRHIISNERIRSNILGSIQIFDGQVTKHIWKKGINNQTNSRFKDHYSSIPTIPSFLQQISLPIFLTNVTSFILSSLLDICSTIFLVVC